MLLFKEIRDSLLHLAFPHICQGCGTDRLQEDHLLCLRCLSALPRTNFSLYPDNPIEQIFWGRVPVNSATALYYFTKESMMQDLIHQLKYRGNKELGRYLGELMGHEIKESNRFTSIEALVPLPLHQSKEHKRGYNQATILCEGIAKILNKPILTNVVARPEATETQTRKNRIERWQNMVGKFKLIDASPIEEKHVLLIDDVITTGATLEACGQELLQAKNVQLSVGTLCFSFH